MVNNKTINRILGVLLLIFLVHFSVGQVTSNVSIETQVYPTGVIPGLRFDHFIQPQDAIHLRLALQLIDHRDLGVQDKEWGNGAGFSLGYLRYFKNQSNQWFTGLRNDFWWNSIDWKDKDLGIQGLSKITVLQPTIIGGHSWRENHWFYQIHLGFGLEWNVQTQGRPVGEGPILLLGINIGLTKQQVRD